MSSVGHKTEPREPLISNCTTTNNGEEISTRELRENVEGKNDTIANVLNELVGQGRLKRRKECKQKVLWSLVRDEKSPLKPVPPPQTGSLKKEKKITGLNSINTNGYPRETQTGSRRFHYTHAGEPVCVHRLKTS